MAEQQKSIMSGWDANLKLTFTKRADKTILTQREHSGPLVVQKTLYPEGNETAHLIILHPPGGVAGGDRLVLSANLLAKTYALLTTPGATKWYKANNRKARQVNAFKLENDSILEWMPQENIIFDAADVELITEVELSENAIFSSWEITCLGRQAGLKKWSSGSLRQVMSVWRDKQLIWHDTAVLKPNSLVVKAKAGLNDCSIFGSFIIAAGSLPEPLLDACRIISVSSNAKVGVTAMNHVISARYMGESSQEARQYFEQLWQCLRPWYGNRKVHRPRIWAT